MQTDRPAAELKLVVEEAEVERRVVRDQRRIFQEFEQLLDPIDEERLVRRETGC